MDLMAERAKVPLFLTYRAVGSSTGQKEFLGQSADSYAPLNHFGAGDIPMSASRYAELVDPSQANREMVHIPFVMGAISFFHSVPSGEIGASAIDLDACLLARIFKNEITTWDHADILAANPGMNVPANTEIKMVHRTLGSSSTTGITEYLLQKCPAHWDLGSGSTITWNGGFAAQGSGGVSDYIENTPYAIGYLDAGHGHNLGLSEIALKNLNNIYLTSTDADIASTVNALTGPIFPTDPSSDFSAVNLYDLAGDQAWPITMVTYLYLQKDMSAMDADTAAALQAFVEFIMSTEGQELAATFSFVPLAQNVLDYNNATLTTVVTWPTSMVDFTFETSTEIWAGAGDRVLSVKRRSFAEYERSNFARDIEDLQTKMTAVESTIAFNTAAAGSCSCDDHDDEKNLAAAAIALSIISLLVSVAAICLGQRQSNKRSGMDKCTPSIIKNGHVEMSAPIHTLEGNTV